MEPGLVLGGKYRLVKRIGRGGMGEVWRADDPGLGRQVAIKIVLSELDGGSSLLERFRREASTAAALQHPGITVIHDIGEHEGHPYFAMELLTGTDFETLLKDNRRGLPVDRVLSLAIPVAEALGYAHRNGVIHRDIKPANLFELAEGGVKICDFGVASYVNAASSLTQAGTVLGTPAYMAPEQYQGHADARSDLYSLGCTLYAMLTGAPPFTDRSMFALMHRHLTEAAPPPTLRRPETPAGLERLVLELLAKNPSDRPASAAIVERRLRGLVASGDASQSAYPVTAARSMPPVLPVPRQLPGAARGFVGRSKELDTLTRLLDESDPHGATVVISAVTGTAGVGKTALAVHWAHQVRDRFPDGDLYVNLHGYGPSTPLTPEQALDAMLLGLEVPRDRIPVGAEAKSAAYRSQLTGRRMLLLLDNAADAEQVRSLLPGSPGCMTLITSRNRLVGLAASDGAHPVSLDHMTEPEALSLLRQIIGAARLHAEPEAARDIARRCGFLPLALRIAAERTAARPGTALAEVAADLSDEQRRLDMLDTDDPATAVRAVFSWSYCALPADLARVFRLLGLMPWPVFPLEAAATLIDRTPAMARYALDRLNGLHLLEETTHSRYHFHDLLHSFAAEAARNEESDDDRTAAERRILAWVLHAMKDTRTAIFPQPFDFLQPVADLTYWPPNFTTPGQALEFADREVVGVHAVTRRAAEAGHHDIAWRIPVECHLYLFMRKCWTGWTSTLQVALASARHVNDRDGEAYVLTSLGLSYYDLRRLDEARSHYQAALTIFRDTGNHLGEASALNGLGSTYRRLRRFDEAIDYCQQALTLYREADDPLDEGLVLIQLGSATGSLHRFGQAIEHFQTALTVTDPPDKRIQAWAHNGLSYVYRGLGRHQDSIDHADRALVLFQEIDDWWGQGEGLYNLGRTQFRCGRNEAARQSLAAALTIFEEMHTPRADRVRAYLQILENDSRSRPGADRVTSRPT